MREEVPGGERVDVDAGLPRMATSSATAACAALDGGERAWCDTHVSLPAVSERDGGARAGGPIMGGSRRIG